MGIYNGQFKQPESTGPQSEAGQAKEGELKRRRRRGSLTRKWGWGLCLPILHLLQDHHVSVLQSVRRQRPVVVGERLFGEDDLRGRGSQTFKTKRTPREMPCWVNAGSGQPRTPGLIEPRKAGKPSPEHSSHPPLQATEQK